MTMNRNDDQTILSLPLSRRKFLGGLGSVAIVTAAASGVNSLALDGSQPDVLEDGDLYESAEKANSAGIHFADVFAPSESLVKVVEQPYRQDICLNGAWKFQPISLPVGFRSGQDSPPHLPLVEADRWEEESVYVPSPWNVNSFADHHGEGGDFHCYPSYPTAWDQVEMGWLRKALTVPSDWKGKRVYLHFDAVAGSAEILVNNKQVGSHFDIFLPFDLDVTSMIVFGGDNEVLVGVRKASLFDRKGEYGRRTYQGGSFWGQHIVGIWQDVFLVAVPLVSVSDIFVLPKVDIDLLQAEVMLRNDGDRDVEISISAQVFSWLPSSTKIMPGIPLPSSELGTEVALELPRVTSTVPANGTARTTLQGEVRNRLKFWNCTDPNLYGLVVKVTRNGETIDSKYTRFGWRQIAFRGAEVMLNGEPLILRGDSWHFMGIPQMTRRYPWAWFTALRQAGLNAVRLHAQPYPEFYLDVADEMGILVLDETAMWASDGGPKLDDPGFWQDTERHLASLVMRDRNHPCVFGWSVCNEMMPIVRFVMRNPPGLMDELVRHYSVWAGICGKLDPTRPWISADGDEDGAGKLPVFVIHYGGVGDMQRANATGKPWGVGETGNAYYGTPEQVAETIGERAYESFEGRMEGVAISSFESLIEQREHHAHYRSVFNLVWYGLRPLPLGLADTTRPPTLKDGIFFSDHVEGQPGAQPQRLGPYCSTLNPGYDPSLRLYETWPLFEAIRDASAEPPAAAKWNKPPVSAKPPAATPASDIPSAKVIAGGGSMLAVQLENIGVTTLSPISGSRPQLLCVDGANPPSAGSRTLIDQVLASGGTVLVLGAAPGKLEMLNALLPARLEVTLRVASSLLPVLPSAITAGLEPSDLYFSDQRPPDITESGLAGPLIEESKALLKACDTDWLKWNNQPEYAKTAMVVRSEQEAKPSGIVLADKSVGRGRLLLTTLSSAPRSVKAERIVRTILANLRLSLKAGMDSGKPLLRTGVLVRALACGYFAIPAVHPATEPWRGNSFRAESAMAGKRWRPIFQESGVFDLTKLNLPGSNQKAEAYLSFWLQSPRSLDDLLVEPNLPEVDFHCTQSGSMQAWLNDQQILDQRGAGRLATASALKLRAGWNHLLIKLTRTNDRWEFAAYFTASQRDFLSHLDSSLELP